MKLELKQAQRLHQITQALKTLLSRTAADLPRYIQYFRYLSIQSAAKFSCISRKRKHHSFLSKVQQYSSYSTQSPFQQAPDIQVKQKSKARCKSWSENYVNTYPSPKAKTWDMNRDGMKTLRNSAEKMPPFFIAPLFLILKDTERLGCLKWNSLKEEGEERKINTIFFGVFSFFFFAHKWSL